MIADVDASLRALLSGCIADEKATITFDTPSDEWAAKLKGPTVNLLLYDVREDLDGRKADWEDVRGDNGRVVGRQPPPRRYQLSYFVSAWDKTAEAEHHLLSEILRTIPGREIIPFEYLEGVLATQEMPVVLQVGIPGQGAGMRMPEIWSALGVRPKAAMELVVLAPLRPEIDTVVAPPAEEMALGMSRERTAHRPLRPPKGSREEREAAREQGEAPAEEVEEGVPGLPGGKRWAGFKFFEKGPDDE